MKVLYQIRKDFMDNLAGDSIVFLNLRKHLQDQGIKIDICTDENINIKSYDLVHIFNTIRTRESYGFMKNAKQYNKKVVLTPIYWDLRDYFTQTDQIVKKEAWEKSEDKRKYLFENCDMYLPHCEGEAELIRNNYRVNTKYVIIPYGVDESFKNGNKNYIRDKYGVEEYILCVGRIHHQKNQLNLMKAMSNERIPIVLVGSINDKRYYRDCMSQKKENIMILQDVKREALKSIYKGALLHVLPSWIEYPGLVSLEAGIAGCKVVSTEIGSAKEVLADYADYCNPSNIDSIYNAIMSALHKTSTTDLRNYIEENYTWHKIAKKAIEAYHSLI